MLKFDIKRVDKKNNNTPILYDNEIDEFAQAVMRDYKPKLLREPGAVRFEHFLESYLGLTILYKDIYYDDPKQPILGATAFNDETLRVFDHERMCVSVIPIDAGTVIIDNSVMEAGKEKLAQFTGLHEGGHYLIHPDVYTRDNRNQLSLFDEKPLKPVVCCRNENIESFGLHKKSRTPAEWREHHADYFAAAFAMPNATFRPLVNQLLRENDVKNGYILTGMYDELDYLAECHLPETLSEIYGVSKKAALIKLRKLGFVLDQRAYEQKVLQLSL